MDAESVQKFILESFRDREVVKAFSDHILDAILTPALKFRDDEMQALRNQMKAKDDEISELRQRLDDQEQYSRKYCVVFKGVVEKGSEDAGKIVTDLAAAAGVRLETTDIDVAHRLRSRVRPGAGTADNKPRDLIVKFTNMTKRKELWAARRKFSSPPTTRSGKTRSASTSTPNTSNNIFITESLTKYRAEIMFRARELKRQKKLAAAWTDEGVMKVRRGEGEKTVVVRTMRDIHELIGHKVAESDKPVK